MEAGEPRAGQEVRTAPAPARAELARIIREYILASPELVLLFVLVDSRHDIGKIDLDFIRDLGENGVPFAIIFTKGDKQGPNVLAAQVEKDRQILLEEWEELPPMFVSSAQTGAGKEDILSYIENVLANL
jgi:GTP-binding protein